jgi:hypothetical protein
MMLAIRQLLNVALLRMTADGKAAQLKPADWPGDYEAATMEKDGRRYMLVGEPLFDQLVAKSTAHETSRKNSDLTAAMLENRRLKGQMQGLLMILKGKLKPDERIPDSAWELLHSNIAYVAGEDGDEEAQR